jgi:hypothetical protein
LKREVVVEGKSGTRNVARGFIPRLKSQIFQAVQSGRKARIYIFGAKSHPFTTASNREEGDGKESERLRGLGHAVLDDREAVRQAIREVLGVEV